MLKKIMLMVVACMVFTNLAYAGVKTVLINSGDYSEYRELHTNEILDQTIIDRLLHIGTFDIYEKSFMNDTLDMEQEMVADEQFVEAAVEKNDFNTIFGITQNDISMKRSGDSISVQKTALLGEKYDVKYIIHGSIDFIGRNNREKIFLYDKWNFTHGSKSVTIMASLRIIEAKTGKIIWYAGERGKVADRFDALNNVSYGTKEFSNILFYEALDKVSEKLTEKLVTDLQCGMLRI